jgi:hypothetical protein
VPALRLPVALLIYQPLALIFGGVAAVRGWRRTTPYALPAKWLGLWALAALILAMLYPARQIADLIWVLAPLWALAALELAERLAIEKETQSMLISAGQATMLFVLMAFAWNYLLMLSSANLIGGEAALRSILVLLVGVIGMGTVATALVALGWTWPIAHRGLVWGVSITLGLYMLAAGWGAWQVRPSGEQELWTHLPSAGETKLLVESITDISRWKTGFPNSLDVVVLADSPSLRWALRDWPGARYASELSPGELPSLIVAYKGQDSPALAASYRGQDFPWEAYPAWDGVLPADLARWLAFRKAPSQENEVILWVRADLFPGGIPETQAGIEAIPEENAAP